MAKQVLLLAALVGSVVGKVSKEPLFNWSKGLNPNNVLHAINCGANEYHTDVNGVKWMPDIGSTGGFKSSEGSNHRWIMPDTEVYHTERWSNENFSYMIPFDVNEDGDYVLVLKFSEQYFSQSGEKVFDVKIGDKVVLDGLDPLAMAGAKLLPYDAFIEIKTKRGEVYINGGKVKGAVKKESLLVTFVKGPADNPKINAIALVSGGLKNTHKASFDKYQATLHAINNEKAEARAKEEALFNEDLYDFEDSIDGRGLFNQMLSHTYLFEALTIVSMLVFFRVIPNSTK